MDGQLCNKSCAKDKMRTHIGQHIILKQIQAVAKGSNSNPCTNRPISCKKCQICIWSSNMKNHYFDKHQGISFEESCLPDTEEVNKLKSLKF